MEVMFYLVAALAAAALAPIAFLAVRRCLIWMGAFIVAFVPKRIAYASMALWALALIIRLAPFTPPSVFAQSFSPSAVPNTYITSSPPASCVAGTLIYTTDNVGFNFCNGSNTFRAVPTFGNIATATTLNNIPYWSTTTGTLSSSGVPYSLSSANNSIIQSNGLYLDQSWFPQYFSGMSAANDSTTGTTQFHLATINSAGHAITLTTSQTAIEAWVVVSNTSTTGNAKLATTGAVTCTADGAVTAGDFIVASTTTPGDCHDSGTSVTSAWIIGIAENSIGSGGNFTVSLATGFYGGSGGGGGITSISFTDPTSLFTISPGSCSTSTCTFTQSLTSAGGNLFWGGPNGSSGTPSYRALAAADISSAYSCQTVTDSSTVTVNFSPSSGNPLTCVQITLSVSTTTLSVSNANTGSWYVFLVTQPGGGGDAVTWSGFHGAVTIDSTAVASTKAVMACIATAATTMYCIPGEINVP